MVCHFQHSSLQNLLFGNLESFLSLPLDVSVEPVLPVVSLPADGTGQEAVTPVVHHLVPGVKVLPAPGSRARQFFLYFSVHSKFVVFET